MRYFFICLGCWPLLAQAQLSLTASGGTLCEGMPVSLSLINSYPAFYQNGRLQRNNVTIATTSTGQLNYTATTSGEYQYVYYDKDDFRLVNSGSTSNTSFVDMQFMSTNTGFALATDALYRTTDGVQAGYGQQ